MFKLLTDILFGSLIGIFFYFFFYRNFIGLGLNDYNITDSIGKTPINITTEYKIDKVSYYIKYNYYFNNLELLDCNKLQVPFFLSKECDYTNNVLKLESHSINFLL